MSEMWPSFKPVVEMMRAEAKKVRTSEIYGKTVCISASGSTLTAAREALAVKVAEALDRLDFGPLLYSHRGWLGIVWPSPAGAIPWLSAVHPIDETAHPQVQARCYEGHASLDLAISRTLLSLAELACDIDDPSDTITWMRQASTRQHVGPEPLEELCRWLGFQRAYKRAPAELPDHEKHAWACDHGSEFKPSL